MYFVGVIPFVDISFSAAIFLEPVVGLSWTDNNIFSLVSLFNAKRLLYNKLMTNIDKYAFKFNFRL